MVNKVSILFFISFFLFITDYKQDIIEKDNLIIINTAPIYIQAGETLFIRFKSDNIELLKKIKIKFDNKEVPILKLGDNVFAIISIDIRKNIGKYPLIILKNSSGDFEEIYKTEISVNQSKRISVDFGKEPKRSKKFLNKYWRERDQIIKIISASEKKPLFNEKFILPLDTIKVSGEFGERRVYRNGRVRIHRGVDLVAPKRTKVYAINSGKVMAVKYFTFEGKCVIIDHGAGIISFYMHLDEFRVKEGEFVKKGQVIGLSGSSGNSRSPHLHFAIKVNNATIDPLKFIELINENL